MRKSQGQGAETPSAEVAVNEKRARFDALTPVSVSSAEVRNIPFIKGGYVDRLVQWLQPKRVLGSYKNDDTGWGSIIFNKASVKNVANHKAGAGKVALLEAVPVLIKNGIYLDSIRKNAQGLMTHVFAAKATIDGVPYAVSYAVREDANGRRYYDHSLTKIEVLDRIDDQAPIIPAGEPQKRIPVSKIRSEGGPAGEELLSNILKKHLKVNSGVKNKKTKYS